MAAAMRKENGNNSAGFSGSHNRELLLLLTEDAPLADGRWLGHSTTCRNSQRQRRDLPSRSTALKNESDLCWAASQRASDDGAIVTACAEAWGRCGNRSSCPAWAALQRAGKATLRRWRRHRLEVEAFGELEPAMRRSWRPSCVLTPRCNLGQGLFGRGCP
ncbi:uncharacterized protein [Dermacentor albipictus]|uniref:uncharacterized protein n=1 Tax=Dermacentor albipictus TaxID=60249 RepID=UPI0038FC14D4